MTHRTPPSARTIAFFASLVVCLTASWPQVGAAQSPGGGVCFTSHGEHIGRIAETFVIHAKPAGSTSQWEPWDRQFWARAERLVAEVNQRAKTAGTEPMIQYDLYAASSRATLRRSGSIHATGVLCTRSQRRACRSRSYSAQSSVTPERLAEIVVENTLRQRPDLPQCQLRSPGKRSPLTPGRRFHNAGSS